MVLALVQSIDSPTNHQCAHDAKKNGMTDSAVKREIVQLTQKVLAEYIHVRNGARDRPPNHGPVADAAS